MHIIKVHNLGKYTLTKHFIGLNIYIHRALYVFRGVVIRELILFNGWFCYEKKRDAFCVVLE